MTHGCGPDGRVVVKDDAPQFIDDITDLVVADYDAPVVEVGLLQLLVRVSIDGSTGNVDHHLHRHLEGQLINAERHIQRDDSRFSKFLFEQLATFSISRRVNGSVKSDVALKGENRFRTSTDVL